MIRGTRGPLACLLAALLLGLTTPLVTVGAQPVAAAVVARPGFYTNPLKPRTSSGEVVESCADPSVLRGRGAWSASWFMYCTTDPLNDAATSAPGPSQARRLPMMRSSDLVHWRFAGSALSAKPSWAAEASRLWAPDVVYSSAFHRYYLVFAVTDTRDAISGEPGCDRDPAIAVAVARTPVGPWAVSSRPLVPPRRIGPGCSFASTIDPDLLGDSVGTSTVLYVGGFRAGVRAHRVTLRRGGMVLRGAWSQVSASTRFEGANVVLRDGWYYLTLSGGACCLGRMSGYGVFSGRSRSPFGPFVDRDGVPLTAARTGGTPMLVMNGNRWVGPGHSSLFRDRGGRWWLAYHAIEQRDPYFATTTLTRRPPMLDPVDWVGGFPVVRNGRGPSQTRMPAPAGRAGQVSAYRPSRLRADVLGARIARSSDEFDGTTLDPRWTWVREPDPSTYAVGSGSLRLDTSPGQLYESDNTAPVLTLPAPAGDFAAQTTVAFDVPGTGTGHDAAQAGIVVYGSDDSYVKLVHSAAGPVRLTVLGRELPNEPARWPRYGHAYAGTPGATTRLRIVRRTTGSRSVFRAWTQRTDGHWVRGPAWARPAMNGDVRIGLIAMGRAGYTARFDHVRVWRVLS